jgi:acetylornithine/N-succinyldiaminopimelate aminotransferase
MNRNSETNRLFLRHVAQTSPNPLGLEIASAEGLYLYDRSGTLPGSDRRNQRMQYRPPPSPGSTGHKRPGRRYLHLLVYGELIQSPQCTICCPAGQSSSSFAEFSIYFTNSGAEATEGAMKLAKRVTGRTEIVAFNQSYHGSTQGALSIMGDEYWRNAFRPLLARYPPCWITIQPKPSTITTKRLASLPKQYRLKEAYTHRIKNGCNSLRQRCDEKGALLVFDEIQAGFGRTGTLWAFRTLWRRAGYTAAGKGIGRRFTDGSLYRRTDLS